MIEDPFAALTHVQLGPETSFTARSGSLRIATSRREFAFHQSEIILVEFHKALTEQEIAEARARGCLRAFPELQQLCVWLRDMPASLDIGGENVEPLYHLLLEYGMFLPAHPEDEPISDLVDLDPSLNSGEPAL